MLIYPLKNLNAPSYNLVNTIGSIPFTQLLPCGLPTIIRFHQLRNNVKSIIKKKKVTQNFQHQREYKYIYIYITVFIVRLQSMYSWQIYMFHFPLLSNKLCLGLTHCSEFGTFISTTHVKMIYCRLYIDPACYWHMTFADDRKNHIKCMKNVVLLLHI